MIAEIKDGSVDDPNDELLGVLLKGLYPGELSASDLLDHLRQPKMTSASGEYTNFWTRHVPGESTPEQLGGLLDGIAGRFADYRSFMVGDVGLYTYMGHLPIALLEKALRGLDGGHCRGPAVQLARCGLGSGSPGVGVGKD